MKNLIIISLILLAGCKPIKYVPIETIKIEYRDKEKLRVDTLIRYDSIYVKDSGDTVFIEKYKFLYRYRDLTQRDSIHIHDSIPVPYPVVEYKEVNKLTKWQSWQIMTFRILAAAGLLYGLFKTSFVGKLLSKLKLLQELKKPGS